MATLKFQGVLTPASVAVNTSAEQIFTVGTGMDSDAQVSVTKPTAQAGLAIAGARVASATTIGVTFVNDTAGAIVPTAAEPYQFLVSK